jgi:hypothetical protein
MSHSIVSSIAWATEDFLFASVAFGEGGFLVVMFVFQRSPIQQPAVCFFE